MSEVNDRFDSKWMPEPNTGCWIWIGTIASRTGYGQISVAGKMRSAHRVAYERWVGPVPEGLVIDHICRQRCCVNPCHLEPVTTAENLRRGVGTMGDRQREKTHCPQGHPYAGGNLIINRCGHRTCRRCAKDQWDDRVRSRGGRTYTDKRDAVFLVLMDPGSDRMSNREVGRRAGVSHTLVGRIRRGEAVSR